MIQGVTTLMLNELIDERGEKVIYSTVGRYCDKDKTQRFIENIVRSFTIKNLIGQLTILNPDKIMGDVEETVSKLEILEEKFSTLMTQIQPDKGLEWLSVSELSEYLPTHPVEHTIYCWTSNKQIPFHKKGKRIMFLKSEIDEWMQDNKSRSRAEIMNEAIAYVQSTRKVI